MTLLKYTEEDFRSIYKRIYRAGYLSKNAGDMWEPDIGVEDLVKIANNKLDLWMKIPDKIEKILTKEQLNQLQLKINQQTKRISKLEKILTSIWCTTESVLYGGDNNVY